MNIEDIERILRDAPPGEPRYFPVPLAHTSRRGHRRRWASAASIAELVAVAVLAALVILLVGVLPPRGTQVAGPAATTPGPGSPAAPEARRCSAADLEVTAAAEGAGGAVAGGVAVVNRSRQACTLSGYPGLELRSQNGDVLVSDTGRFSPDFQSVETITLEPRTGGDEPQATAQFNWQNWCRPEDPAELTLVVRLPSEAATTSLPLPLSATPRCEAPGEPATLTVGPFVIR